MAERRFEVVRSSGTWLYDGSVETGVHIVSLSFDFWHDLAMADGLADPDEKPELNENDVAHYVFFGDPPVALPVWPDSVGFLTIDEAIEAAQARVPSEITWV